MLEQRDWRGKHGASANAIEELRGAAPISLPESYLRLLSLSNGGEGPLPVSPFWVQLDAAHEVAASFVSGNHGRRDLDGFAIFGSNGAGEFLALDTRNGAPWSVVSIDMVGGPESAEVVAADFDEFIRIIGVDAPAP